MKKVKENISIGIDLGISSVGYSIVNLSNNEIIDKGVIGFKEAELAKDRRSARGVRRRLKRRGHREERIKKLFKENNIKYTTKSDSLLLEKRLKGLKEKLQMIDIYNIISYFAKHRGYIPFADETRENEYIQTLRDKGYYACEIQKQLLEEFNQYRGDAYPVLHSDYLKELRKIFDVQKDFHKDLLSDDLIDQIIKIIDSKRKFYEGPGLPKLSALTPFGRYTNKSDLEKYKENNSYNKFLYEKLIGSCSVYANERVASATNYYAEEFNFYNDIINLSFSGDEINENNEKYFIKEGEKYKLNKEGIKLLKAEVLNASSVNYEKILKKSFFVENFSGFKKNSNNKPEIAKFESFKKLSKNFKDNEELFLILTEDIDEYNLVVETLHGANNTGISAIKETLKDKLKGSKLEKIKEYDLLLDLLSSYKLANSTLKYHSFSKRALKKYLEIMKREIKNSSYIERIFKDEIKSDARLVLVQNYINPRDGKLVYISNKYIDDLYASPVVKKALRKAIKGINAIIKKYKCYPEYICIETTRSLLSSKKQREYEEKTLENNRVREAARKKLKDMNVEDSEINIKKQILLEETLYKCIYCGAPINIYNVETEHILPFSKSGDDSFTNKVASCGKCNAQKGDKTPYMFLNPKGEWKAYKERVLSIKNLSEQKVKNLFFEGNIDKDAKRFIARNLNDTAYATNELANQIKLFLEAYKYHNNEEINIKVLRTPGIFTSNIRTKYKIEKDRDFKFHHAVDASIVAFMPKCDLGRLSLLIQNNPEKFFLIEKVENFREDIKKGLYIPIKVKEALLNADFSNTRYSLPVDRSPQGKMHHENIAKVIRKKADDNSDREEYCIISQINNIYSLSDNEFKYLKEIFEDKGKRNLLIKEKDKLLYDKLKDIFIKYKEYKEKYIDKNGEEKETSLNPYVAYIKENSEEEISAVDIIKNIHKYGVRRNEKETSPIVKRLRYYEKTNNPYILNKKSINQKENTLIMLNSLKQAGVKIFRGNVDKKFYFLPMYSIFLDKKGKAIEDHFYYKEIYNKFVGKDKDVSFFMDVYNNEYLIGIDKNGNKKEGFMSTFHKVNNNIVLKKGEDGKIPLIISSLEDVVKLNIDILGKYNLNVPK